MDGLTIGKVARSAGLAIDTVRYYERERLIEKLATACSGRGPTSECPILEAMETRELAS